MSWITRPPSNSLKTKPWKMCIIEVEFQLDLCSGDIDYQDLLKHLSVAFQGGDNEANLLAEFYSCMAKKLKSQRRLSLMNCKSLHKESHQ